MPTACSHTSAKFSNALSLNLNFTGTSVVTVKASASIPDPIKYSIFSGNEDGVFSLGSASGNPSLLYDASSFCLTYYWLYWYVLWKNVKDSRQKMAQKKHRSQRMGRRVVKRCRFLDMVWLLCLWASPQDLHTIGPGSYPPWTDAGFMHHALALHRELEAVGGRVTP